MFIISSATLHIFRETSVIFLIDSAPVLSAETCRRISKDLLDSIYILFVASCHIAKN